MAWELRDVTADLWCATHPDPRERIAALYRWYAEVEAAGRSELFGQMAIAVAADPATLDFLAALPKPKWQPNLLLGAVRYLFGTPPRST